MVWSRLDMHWDPWREMRRLQREMDRVFHGVPFRPAVEFPPVNVWKSADGVVVTAELPGISPDGVDVSVMKDTLTLRGERKVEGPGEEGASHRRERGGGRFLKSIQLPYDVDADKCRATYERGILRIELPRAESHRPKRITVK